MIILTAVVAAVAFCGCYKTRQEVIPTNLGTPEGYYIYMGNTRSLTDGSNKERIIDVVELDGKTYSGDEYEIIKITYIQSAHAIFYVLSVDDVQYIYRYDYKEKTGVELSSVVWDEESEITVRDGFIYFNSSDKYLLYDVGGTLLCDSINGTLSSGGFLYTFFSSYDNRGLLYCNIKWFYKGAVHTVTKTQDFFHSKYSYRYDDYLYFLDYKNGLIIDMVSGEYYEPPVLQENYSDYTKGYCIADGALFFLKENCTRDESGNIIKSQYSLYKADGTDVSIAKKLDDTYVRWDIYGTKGRYLYLEALTPIDGYYNATYFSYYIPTGVLKEMRDRPNLGNRNNSKTKSLPNYIRVGNYEFYTEAVQYKTGNVVGAGWPEVKSCYYLWRRKGLSKVIMQYSFSGGYFYDDICEF